MGLHRNLATRAHHLLSLLKLSWLLLLLLLLLLVLSVGDQLLSDEARLSSLEASRLTSGLEGSSDDLTGS